MSCSSTLEKRIPNPTSDSYLSKILNTFVDDTNLWDILFSCTKSPSFVAHHLQKRAQFWEKLLFTSGGKLKFKKCFWYLIKWNWDNNGNPELASIAETPASVHLSNGNDNGKVEIQRKECTDALETLGIWTSPSHKCNKNFLQLKKKISSITTVIRSLPLTPDKAALIIPVHNHPKLNYHFSATCFSERQCAQIDSTYRSHAIAKMGHCSKTPTTIVNSSYPCGGMNIPTSWNLQGCLHLKLLIGHLQLNDLTGQTLSHELDVLCLHIGLLPKVLSYNISLTKQTSPPCWLAHTWEYSSSVDAALNFNSLQLSQQQENNVPLMEVASMCYSGVTYRCINDVRKCKQIFFLSDIVTSDGLCVDNEALTPVLDQTRKSLLQWPFQSIPGKKAWQEWRSFLNACVCHSNLKLCTPLGNWIPSAQRTQRWFSLVDPNTKAHCPYDDNDIWKIAYPCSRPKQRLYLDGDSTSTLPSNLVPITVQCIKGNLTGTKCRLQIPSATTSSPPIDTSLYCYLQTLPKSLQWTLGSVLSLSKSEIQNIRDCVSTGKFVLGSDGSLLNNGGSYASRLQSTATSTTFISLRKQPFTDNAFATETYGHLSILILLRAIILCHHTVPSNNNQIINSYIDNLGLIKRLLHGNESSISHTQQSNSHPMGEIHSILSQLPFNVQWHHVKSHNMTKNKTWIRHLYPLE